MNCNIIRDERFGESANTNGKESFGKFSLEHGGFFVGEDVKARVIIKSCGLPEKA